MKKLFSVVLALCLLAGLLSLTAMAESPNVTVNFRNAGTGVSSVTISATPGSTNYVTTEDQAFVKWTDDEAPTDNYIKIEYPAEGEAVLNVTMKNIDHKSTSTGDWSSHSIQFSKADYKVVITLEGENKMEAGSVSMIKSFAQGGITITGSGKLTTNQTGSVSGSIWMASDSGDLLIKNTTLDMTVAQNNHSLHHAILSNSGNVTFEGAKVTCRTHGGGLVYFGQPQKTGDQVGRYTLDPDETRKLTIKDSEITATVEQNNTVFYSKAPAVISNSTLNLKTLNSNGPLISPAPTFEGDYTAIAGLVKNAEKLDKLKYYDVKKLSSYTYIYIVPGIQELLPTETEPEVTVPDVTDPDPIVPDVTVPDATTPDASTPDASIPVASTPSTSTPSESNPTTNTPNATQPAGSNAADKTDDATKVDNADKKDDNDGNTSKTLTVILIILVVVVVAVGATFGVLFYLKKKKA